MSLKKLDPTQPVWTPSAGQQAKNVISNEGQHDGVKSVSVFACVCFWVCYCVYVCVCVPSMSMFVTNANRSRVLFVFIPLLVLFVAILPDRSSFHVLFYFRSSPRQVLLEKSTHAKK